MIHQNIKTAHVPRSNFWTTSEILKSVTQAVNANIVNNVAYSIKHKYHYQAPYIIINQTATPFSTSRHRTDLQQRDEEEEDVGVAPELLEQELGQEREHAVLGRGDGVGDTLVGRLLLVDVDSARLGHLRRAGRHRAGVLICRQTRVWGVTRGT